jgi:hypothetical protein
MARRRIIPELISAPHHVDNQGGWEGAEALQIAATRDLEVVDLRAEAANAEAVLGPGRKMYVDLSVHTQQQPIINWRKVWAALELAGLSICAKSS